jgi:NTE family protein
VAFHTGVLWRLNQLGLLAQISRVSAVSGGAVLAGYLAMAWPKFGFAAGIAENFNDLVVRPVENLLDLDIGTKAALLGLLPGRTGNGELTRFFQNDAFGGVQLGQLEGRPDFVFCATDLRHGSLWTFEREKMGNDATGWFDAGTVKLAEAVAAASAFPPILAPARLDLRLYPPRTPATGAGYKTAILCDGGVYDDLGLDPAAGASGTILISDADEELAVQERPAANWVGQLMRVRQIAMSQVRLQRLAHLPGTASRVSLTAPPPPDGIYAGFNSGVTAKLTELPTRFVRMGRQTRKDLINWGYVACDVAMRGAAPAPIRPAQVPYPA